jgi:hypothetical protein
MTLLLALRRPVVVFLSDLEGPVNDPRDVSWVI